MAKRARSSSDQLTGGTGDVNPQYISGLLTLSAANTATEVVIGTPIVRVGPQTSGQAIIMELISLWVDMPAIDLDAAGATTRTSQFSFATVSAGSTPAIATLDNPRCILFIENTTRNAFTAAGTGTLDRQEGPRTWNFTDGAGHGILVATDNLFVVGNTANQTGASTFRWKMSYRFKKVSLIEYIGIVQSQQ